MGDVVGELALDTRAPVPTPAVESESHAEPSPEFPVERQSRLRFWRSPPEQPTWARPTLLAVAALAALSYGWGLNHDVLETFYAGAARSMSDSWHNFFFGAFDPWGTVSVDKLPGAFWVQALSLRLFGFHIWAIVVPQVVEGTLTVLVLYRAVRRVAGAGAGLVAALALAATPVTVLLNRGNISDSLLILLLVLAADAATEAYMTGRVRPLVLAGLWVGLAFQTKMLQAWLVLPAIYAAYLMAAPALSLGRRYRHIALSAVVALAVSVSWMTVVTLVPAHDRPYVDGSCNDSVFSQVFLYNGADRLSGRVLEQPRCTPPPVAVQATTAGGAPTQALEKGPARFLAGDLGRDAAWLFVPAVIALGGILVARRRRPRTDPWRAAAVLWGMWLILTWCFFASSHFLNDYYLAALAPPMAALCGLGLTLAWRMRTASRLVPATVLVAVLAGAAEALSLIPRSAGVWPWVVGTTLVATGAAVVAIARWLFRTPRTPPTSAARVGLASGAVALLIGAAWASATSVANGLGPFDSPYQSAALTSTEHAQWQHDVASWPGQSATAAKVPASHSIETAETSSEVSQDVLATGHEYLPVGGFTGQVPSTSVTQFAHDVGAGRIEDVLVVVHPLTRNPDMRWTLAHCQAVAVASAVAGSPATVHVGGSTYERYVCAPRDAG
jgi:4-amino-4-deoxy-L-arabinose transferase-like glycosyltransferase